MVKKNVNSKEDKRDEERRGSKRKEVEEDQDIDEEPNKEKEC